MMRLKRLFFIFLMLVAVKNTFSQVTVTASGGTLSASYFNLKDAFDQVNIGTHTGSIIINITANTSEVASAVLNASGSGAASYSSILIKPSGGARTITAPFASPAHLIDLNGADNVTIDGLNSAGNSLTIASATPGTSSAVRFTGDACSNTITRCRIQSASSILGVIYFSTGLVTGNDNNTISNCTIEGFITEFPRTGIYSLGSSTAMDNSGNTVSGNNFANYFNANTLSAGIYILGGNADWTISNNSFYQTGSRTYLTGDIHAGIYISTGSSYTITGNYIGGTAPNAGGGAYTMLGTVATQFTGIHIDAGVTTAVSNVQNNTIANIAISTSSSAALENGFFCGINITGGNVNVGTVTGNTIGATSGIDNITGVSSTTLALMTGIHCSSPGNVSIQNNSIGAISNSVGLLTAINISGAANSMSIMNNTIGNAALNNIRSGSPALNSTITRVAGIKFNAIPNGTITVAGNILRNITAFGITGNGFVRGIETIPAVTGSSVFIISDNTISNLTTYSLLAGINDGQGSATGITFAAGNNSVIAHNSISGISNASTSGGGSIVAGIAHANAANTIIESNQIFNLANAGTSTIATSPSIAAGILIRSGTTTVTVYNNMISLGSGQSTNTAFVGIQGNHGSAPDPADKIYHNTINISGTVSSGAQPSIGIYRGDFSATARTITVDIKNNIITNTRNGGSGKHYAIANNLGAIASATGWPVNACNNNILNASAATIGFWTTDQTFTGWKTASNGDGFSFTATLINYADAVNGDLHLNMGTTPTPVESGGTLVAGITADYDNQLRPGPAGSTNGAAYAPDIGADEFDGVYLDLMPPTISFLPLGFTCSGSSRTLVATITDYSGVPVAGAGLPRLYWRINAGAYTGVTATPLGANQYQFVFGAGAVTGNIVSYYIVAQDAAPAPNAVASPAAGAGGYTFNPPAAGTVPSSPNSYSITTVLAGGTYTVGAAGTYVTLTDALNDYNIRCLGGPVVFELADANYIEPAMLTIIRHPDASAVNTLTIKPAAAVITSVFVTNANGPALKIMGNNIIIEGSNNGSSSRHLTIRNQSITLPMVLYIGSAGALPVNNVTVKNTTLLNGVNTSPAVLVSDGAVPGTPGYFNNIQFINNNIQRALTGIQVVAAAQAGNGSGLNISSNLLNTSGTLAIKNTGIFLQGVDGGLISGNTIGNFEQVAAENDKGISLAAATVNTVVSNNIITNLGSGSGATAPSGINIASNVSNAGIVVTGNTISALSSPGGSSNVSTNGIVLSLATGDVSITRNKIFNIKNTVSGFGAHGILLNSSLPAVNCVVGNNFIADVSAFGSPGNTADDNGFGITVNNGAGYSICYNTVNLFTNQTAAAGTSAALMVTAGVTAPGAINLRNNIFSNMQNGGSNRRCAIYSAAPASVFSAIDFNNYYTLGPDLGFIVSNRTSLADLQTGFGSNLHSLSLAPVFVNASTDLHLTAGASNSLLLSATPLSGYTDDIDQETRSISNPAMGADEIISCGTSPVVYISNISGATYQWQVNTGAGFTNLFNGGVYSGVFTNTLTLTSPPTSFNTYQYRCVVNGISFSTPYTYRVGVLWTGALSTAWNNTGNWSCGTVPDSNTDVTVNTGVPRYPAVGSSVTVRSLKITPGAAVTVNTGFTITLTGR